MNKLDAQILREKIYENNVIDCEMITANSQKLLASLEFTQRESINEIMAIWEAECGMSEPLGRVKLLLAIQDGKLEHLQYLYFHDFQDTKYRDRITRHSTYEKREFYEYNKSYYNNLPLESALDTWTYNFAKKLLSKQNHNTESHLICLLFTNQFDTFYNQINMGENKDLRVSKLIRERFRVSETTDFYTIYGGAWIPIANAKQNSGVSPMFGFSLGRNTSRRFRTDMTIELIFWNKDLKFSYDSEITNSNPLLVNFGVIQSYALVYNSSHQIDLTGRIFISGIDSGIDDPNSQEDSNYSSSALSIGLGTNFTKKISKGNSIGMGISLNYASYSNVANIETELGNASLTANVFYRF